MALKIWTGGSMKKIDTNLHKPVIFLNGTKYKLDKAYTFVNGEKQLIWGESGVQIDYISSTGSLGGGDIFAIGENWANVYKNTNVYRLNISNLANPTLTQSVAWGNVMMFNDYQSNSTNSIFGSQNNKTGNKLSVKNTTGEVVVSATSTLTANISGTTSVSLLGITNNNIVMSISKLLSQTPSRTWESHYYWNNVEKYVDSTTSVLYTGLAQTADEAFIAEYILSGAYGVYSFNISGKSSIGGIAGGILTLAGFQDADTKNSCLQDNGYLYIASNASSSGNYITKRASNDINNVLYTYNAGNGYTLKLFGEIDNLLYVIKMPYSNLSSSSEVKLVLLDKSNLSFVYEKVLPNDPFNENNGVPTFWQYIKTIPQVSKTGFLGVSTYNSSTLGLRIARFSGLL